MTDFKTLRKDFPILDQKVHGHPLIYFDNAATSQKPRTVIDALVHYYERDNANVHRGIHELSNRSTMAYEAARVRAAKFINAKSADEIVFTRGTTEGINLVANSWGTCPWTCKPSAVISLRSPATKSAGRPASACCGDGRNCSTPCRRIKAAAK